MTDSSILDLDALTAPISEASPVGENIRYSIELDQIKEARREDDPTLAQGGWEEDLKVADWKRVRRLAEDILTDKSKDLSVACWLVEAVTRQRGFAGMSVGITLLQRLIDQYWDGLYPQIDPDDDDDLEMRAGPLVWLSDQLPDLIRGIPLTDGGPAALSCIDWDQAQELENLGRKNPDAKAAAESDGKTSLVSWDKAVSNTQGAFYTALAAAIHTSIAALPALVTITDEKFGSHAPRLVAIQDALTDCERLVSRVMDEKGLSRQPPPATGEDTGDQPGDDAGTDQAALAPSASAATSGQSGSLAASVPGGPPRSREEALHRLAEIAAYFEKTEPHSPVSYLVQRAVKWGRMPLDQWLQDVVKDESVLDSLKETLGLEIHDPD